METNNRLKQLLNDAINLHQEGALDQAVVLYKKIIEEDPTCHQAFHLIGLIFAQQKKNEEAMSYIEKAVAIDDKQPNYHNNLANIYKATNQLEKAKQHYNIAIQLNNKYVEAYNNLATIYYKEHDLAKAIDLYHKLLQIKPDHIQAHYNLGLVFIKKREFSYAITQFQNVLSLNPSSIDALYQIGNLYLLQEKFDQALSYYDKVLVIDKEHIESLNNKGVVFIKQQKEQAAIDCFSKIIAFDGGHYNARNNIAALFLQNNLYENALRHYKHLIRLNPDDIEVNYNIGVAYMGLGHLAEAIKSYELVIDKQKNHEDALTNLGTIYMRMGEIKRAIHYFTEAQKYYPANEIVSYMLAALTRKTGVDIPPKSYIKNLFNNYALYFDKQMNETLDYQVPYCLRKLFNIHRCDGKKNAILDLGCGTGLGGFYFKDISNKLVGVDIADQMLDVAKKKNIYDELIEDNILHYLVKQSDSFNLILGAEVLNYFGNLLELFYLVNKTLRKNGYFLFSTEISKTENYRLQESARFAHAQKYIKALSNQQNWKIVASQVIDARKHNKVAVKENIYLLQKN